MHTLSMLVIIHKFVMHVNSNKFGNNNNIGCKLGILTWSLLLKGTIPKGKVTTLDN